MTTPAHDRADHELRLMIGGNYWMDSLAGAGELVPGPALEGDDTVDVAIVGGGYTGLWTAYYLARAEPSLRIAVLEARIAGFGASGRNGGWCSGLYPQSLAALARRHGRDAAVALYRALAATVDEVGRVCQAEGVDCHYAKGGTLVLARTPVQLARAREEVEQSRAFGFGADYLDLLSAQEARLRCGATSVLGATYTPHCAAIHPARLVRGLAAAVRAAGVRIYERTPVREIRPGEVRTAAGAVLRSRFVVRATEGYTASLTGHRRTLAPVYSLMIATEPLPESVWSTVGLARRETFSDQRHLIIYGQRTADNRFAFGGRGAPYHYGSAVRPSFDQVETVHAAIYQALLELFPAIGRPRVTHAWGGPLGVSRDWSPSVGLDPATGLAWAGGYVGDGVAATNLAGRTLADLILGRRSELTTLPWVGHRWPRWVPEPLRWLAINTGLALMDSADDAEARTGRASRRAALFGRLLGQ